MCRLSWNLGASTSWNPLSLSRPVMGLLYLIFFTLSSVSFCICLYPYDIFSCYLGRSLPAVASLRSVSWIQLVFRLCTLATLSWWTQAAELVFPPQWKRVWLQMRMQLSVVLYRSLPLVQDSWKHFRFIFENLTYPFYKYISVSGSYIFSFTIDSKSCRQLIRFPPYTPRTCSSIWENSNIAASILNLEKTPWL